ncbi:right-handed parallel beta-helix repeat-containing protein [Amycolatopsis thermophila]|nr:right-handed parallel beta-helix repeat-containing protein [Amycolatopsis thermophila]
MTARARWATVLLGVLSPLVVLGCTPSAGPANTTVALTAHGTCSSLPPGPAQPPAGAVVVDPAVTGDLQAKTKASPPGTTFWLAPGGHTLGTDEYDQVAPKDGDRYVGAPGAVVDGRDTNRYAFTGKASRVTIENLTVTGFRAPDNEGVVNHDSGADWLIQSNLVTDNRGAGMMAGARQVMKNNCLKDNGQYGLNGCCGDVTDIVLEGNEFVGNNADDVESKYPEGCGCTGAMKFWEVDGADIRGNWIHYNRGPGIWADTNNNDFLIENNLIENNDGTAIFYETSYNAIIRDNTLKRNNLVGGREFVDRDDNFPVAAIYISESGGEPRVPARTDKIDIYGNDLTDNWSGVTLWENADRFCNSPANSSTGTCTLVVKDVGKCSPPGILTDPLRSDCRWKTQNVQIHDNRFAVDPKSIGCQAMCARMAVLSNYGSSPDWSPYQGDLVPKAITFDQRNRWYDNHYVGPWTFVTHDASQVVDQLAWQGGAYRQDQGSTFAVGGGN